MDVDSAKKPVKRIPEKEKNQHIQVVVRARPMNFTEKKCGAVNLVSVVPDRREIIVKEKINATSTRTFTFDKVFGPSSKQTDVYDEVVVPILEEVLMGYSCTIFAYGQTGTGKTFTMEGEKSCERNFSWKDDPSSGIIPRTLHNLFETLGEQDYYIEIISKFQQADFTIRVSFVELYNEELFDLLTGPDDAQRLPLFDDPIRKGSVVIRGLEEVIVRSKEEVYEIMERGARKRQTAATLLNAQSRLEFSEFLMMVEWGPLNHLTWNYPIADCNK
uniref:Kinesin motor domain-containing protein n=1 Tax=Romanomermis culicivorax TaxID=13658 RepID=A0A915J254_ROMCU